MSEDCSHASRSQGGAEHGEIAAEDGHQLLAVDGDLVLAGIGAAEFIGPWNDQAFGLYEVAKYYYQPGWHEVGPTAELLVNRAAWDALPADLQAIVAAAATASAMEYHADYAFHNVMTLQPLVAEHGLELRLFPDDVVEALGRTSLEVLAELGERTPLTRRIHASYMAFLERANVYGQWFDLPMLRMRAATLGRV